LLSPPAIQFKGSGWYVTDYARKPPRTEPSKSDAADTEKKGEAAAKKETESSATKKPESAKSIPDK
jgi:predicted nucleic acid-binding Zn ribbon protein